MLDPFSSRNDPFAGLFPGGGLSRPRPPAAFPPYSDEEAQSLIDEVLGKSLGGLAYVGESLDKPGRAVRGLLSGNPREVLNLIPFSDALGITDPTQAVSGRELLTNLGLPENRPGFSPISDPLDALGDIAGFGTEVALDPLTYVGIGTLTNAGKAAKASGALARATATPTGRFATGALEEGIRQGQRSLLSFAGQPIGTGDVAADLARRYVDKPLDAVLHGTYSPIRQLRPLFDTNIEKVSDPALGRVLDEFDVRTRRNKLAAASSELPVSLMRQFDEDVIGELRSKGRLDLAETASRQLRRLSEGVDVSFENGDVFVKGPAIPPTPGAPPGAPQQFMQIKLADSDKLNEFATLAPGAYGRLQAIADQVMTRQKEFKELEDTFGVNTGDLIDNYVNYAHRSLRMHTPSQFFKGLQRALNVKTAANMSRREVLKDIPGGTEMVNEIAMDAAVSGDQAAIWQAAQSAGKNKAQALRSAAEHIRDTYLGGTELYQGQAKRLARWARGLSPDYANKKIRFFDDTLNDFLKRANYHAKIATNADARLDLIQRFAINPPSDPNFKGISVAEFLARSGLGAKEQIATPSGTTKAVMVALGELQNRGMAGVGGDIGKMVIPQDLAEPALKWIRGWTEPGEMSALVRLYDAGLNFTRDYLTQIFPAFHTRNFVSGLYYNWMSDAFDPDVVAQSAFGKLDPMAYIKPVHDSWKIQRGQPIAPIAGISSPAAVAEAAQNGGVSVLASKELYDLMKAHGVAYTGRSSQSAERVGFEAADDIAYPDPNATFLDDLVKTSGWKQFWANPKAERNRLNPLAVRGVTGDKDAFMAVRVARAVGNAVEWNNRGAHFLSKLKQAVGQGVAPEDAIASATESTKRVHFDYADLTDFERKAMKRLIPFYTFSRKNLPLVLQELMEKPGGKLAQTIRAINEGRQDAGYVPESIGEGAAVSLGGDRFITGFGLPFEEAFDRFAVAPTTFKTVGRTLEKHLAQASPAITLPYSLMTNRDAYFGKDLNELYPFPTDDKLINLLITKSPASRLSKSVRTGIDPRKDLLATGVNLLTGVKIHDVSGGLERQKQIEAGRAVAELLKDQPHVKSFTRYYADPEAKEAGEITPEENLLLRLIETTTRKRKAAAEEGRKKEAGITMRDIFEAAGG